jgi:bleomycin hydrolase
MKNIYVLCFFCFIITNLTFSQVDKAKFITYQPGFYYNVIMKEITGLTSKEQNIKLEKQFKLDFENKVYPTDIAKYEFSYHTLPVSQGNSGTCWAYAATSFMESEAYRINKITVRLSEIYTVYWEYIERAKYFVKTKGNVFLGEGSETNAILRIMKNYGLVPLSAYSGLKNGKNYNDHSQLFEEFEKYLLSVKELGNWNEFEIIENVKNILDKYLGTPPEEFIYEGETYTPQTFLSEYLKLLPNKYFNFMSTKYFPYDEKHELVENDNWWHCNDYYNLNLDDYMYLLNKAITSGYTLSICGDVSEPGYDQISEVAVIPDFDVPSAYINEDARQLRLSNNSTTDDHCIHIVGYQKVGDIFWYLIKDTGSGAFDGKNKGYRFYHEDYIKLKIMNYMVHADIAKEILDKIIK